MGCTNAKAKINWMTVLPILIPLLLARHTPPGNGHEPLRASGVALGFREPNSWASCQPAWLTVTVHVASPGFQLEQLPPRSPIKPINRDGSTVPHWKEPDARVELRWELAAPLPGHRGQPPSYSGPLAVSRPAVGRVWLAQSRWPRGRHPPEDAPKRELGGQGLAAWRGQSASAGRPRARRTRDRGSLKMGACSGPASSLQHPACTVFRGEANMRAR